LTLFTKYYSESRHHNSNSGVSGDKNMDLFSEAGKLKNNQATPYKIQSLHLKENR